MNKKIPQIVQYMRLTALNSTNNNNSNINSAYNGACPENVNQ